MARFVSLNAGAIRFFVALGGVALGFASITSLRADQATMQQQAKVVAKQTPVNPTGTVKGPANPAPAAPDVMARYGKILGPGDTANAPVKLRLPSPDAGEVKIPSPDEWIMRDKLEKLSELSDAQIRAQLDAWPVYNKMSLRDEGLMLQRVQDFRDYHARVAAQVAHEMGLLTMSPADLARFEKEYWDKRLLVDRDFIKQFQPIYQAQRQKMNEELLREFAPAVVQVAPLPAPKPAPPAPAKPGASPNKPAPLTAASLKPAPTAAAVSTADLSPPVGQGPR